MVVEAGEDVEEVGECQESGGSLSPPAGGCSAQLLHHVDAAGAGGGGGRAGQEAKPLLEISSCRIQDQTGVPGNDSNDHSLPRNLPAPQDCHHQSADHGGKSKSAGLLLVAAPLLLLPSSTITTTPHYWSLKILTKIRQVTKLNHHHHSTPPASQNSHQNNTIWTPHKKLNLLPS